MVYSSSIARPHPKHHRIRKSERRPCEDFEVYRPLFDQCATDLTGGIRKTRPFANEQEIRAGEFFILNGQMLYVAAVLDRHIRNGKAKRSSAPDFRQWQRTAYP